MAFDLEALRDSNPLSDYIGARLKLKREGREWVASCPFHQEKTPSFKINDAKGLFYCFGCGEHGDIFDFVQKHYRCDFPTACEYLGGTPTPAESARPKLKLVHPTVEPLRAASVPDSHTPFRAGEPIVAWKPDDNRVITYHPDHVWAYQTVAGALSHYTIRINFENGRKIFVPLRPVWRGEAVVWATAHMDTPRALYGLERLLQAGEVFICEGEKSADACALLLSAPSLSAPKGSVDYTPLTGRDVTVWADADEAGQKHAERVASALVGLAGSVRVVPWDPAQPSGWDAADAYFDGMTPKEALAWIGETAVVIGEPIADPDELPAPRLTPELFDGQIPPPRPWAYGNFLMYQAVTGVAAPPGVGKTTFSFQLGIAFALDMNFGTWAPAVGGGGTVWLYNGEEPKDELKRRFIAACAEMGVQEAQVYRRFAFNSGLNQRLNFLSIDARSGEITRSPDVDIIKQNIIEHGFKLFIIDPLIEFHNVKEDTEGFHAMGAILREIAHDCDCSVLFFHHTPKASNSDNAAGDMNALRGGGPIVGVARFVGTMFNMTAKDAEEYGVPIKERYRYVRFDDAKANMTLVGNVPQWWAKLGISIDNATGLRPADTIGVLRYDGLKSANTPDPEKEAIRNVVRENRRREQVDKIASEMVRICILNGHTERQQAGSLDSILKAMDDVKTGIKVTVARDLVTAEMGQGWTTPDAEIVIFNVPRGKLTVRKIYVEEA